MSNTLIVPLAALNKSRESRTLRMLRDFCGDRRALGAAIVFLVIVLASALAPLIAPHDPLQQSAADRLQPIGTPGHWLGTDQLGRDMLSRILYGGQITLVMGVLPVAIAFLIGLVLGAVAGSSGRLLNNLIMRTLDVFYAFPAVLLAIGIAAALGQGEWSIILATTIVFVPPIARVAESATKSVMVEEYMEAARSSGAGPVGITVHFVIRNVVSRVFVYSSTYVSVSFVLTSGLSFLGLGVAPPTPEWGVMLNDLTQQIFISPWLTVLPGAFIFVSALAVNLVSDGLHDAFETKL